MKRINNKSILLLCILHFFSNYSMHERILKAKRILLERFNNEDLVINALSIDITKKDIQHITILYEACKIKDHKKIQTDDFNKRLGLPENTPYQSRCNKVHELFAQNNTKPLPIMRDHFIICQILAMDKNK